MHFIHGLPAFAIISKHLLKFIDRMRMHMDDAGYTRGVRPTAAALVIWKCLVIPYEKYVGMRFFDSIRRDGIQVRMLWDMCVVRTPREG